MRVTVDSSIWVPPDAPEIVHDQLHERTTHRNPEWLFRKRTDRYIGDCPQFLVLASTDNEGWTKVPRGLAPLVRELMDRHVGEWEWEDKRLSVPLTEPLEFYEDPPPNYHGKVKPEGIRLFDFQREIGDATVEYQNVLVRSPAGSGKTGAAIYAITCVMERTIVIVWDSTILTQWVDALARFLDITPRIIGGGARWTPPESSPVTVAMQQSLASKDARRARDEGRHFGFVILEECFDSTTPVLMEDGSLKKISEVEVGDRVAYGGAVRDTMNRWYAGDLITWNDALATAHHPILSQRGWLLGSEVLGSDLLWYDPIHELRSLWRKTEAVEQARPMSETWLQQVVRCRDWEVPAVWEEGSIGEPWLPCQFEMWNTGSLEQGSYGRRGRTSSASRSQRTSAWDERKDQGCVERSGKEKAACGGDHSWTEKEISISGRAREVSSARSTIDRGREDRSVRGTPIWEWSPTSSGRVGDVQPSQESRVCFYVHSVSERDQREEQADTLQDRSGAPRIKASRRDRWVQSSPTGTQGTRSTEGPALARTRMGSLEVSGSIRLRQGRSRVRHTLPGALRVYNIETENSVYVAGGVLVHNCQRLPARTHDKVIGHFAAKYRLGISESEERKDNREWLTHAHCGEPRVEVPREELVDLGRIMAVRLVVVETDWKLLDDEGASLLSSAFEPDELRREMVAAADRTLAIIDDVEREAKAGHTCLVLARWKDMGRQIKAELWRRGVSTGLLFGGKEMAEEFRLTVRNLNSGEWQVGVGTQKVYQGFDVPGIDRLFIATPSATNHPLLGQQIGRAARVDEGKETPTVYYYWDHEVYRHHKRMLRKFIRKEPERFTEVVLRKVDGSEKPL